MDPQPKWGFLPASQQLSEQTRGIKQTYCRYCMHRYMKQGHKHPMQALETHQTGYCPLDLYSGDQERVSRAIRALWSDWKASCGGTNNIRLFVDGRRVEPHDVSSVPEIGGTLAKTDRPRVGRRSGAPQDTTHVGGTVERFHVDSRGARVPPLEDPSRVARVARA